MKIEKTNVNPDLVYDKLIELETNNSGTLKKCTDWHYQLKINTLVLNIYRDKKNVFNITLNESNIEEEKYIEIFKNIFEVCSSPCEEPINYQLSIDKLFFLSQQDKFFDHFLLDKETFINKGILKINNEITISSHPKKILFQGKYKKLYHDIIIWLQENINEDLNITKTFLIDNKEKMFNKSAEFKDDNFYVQKIKEKLPNSHNFLGDRILIIMSTSLLVIYEDIKSPDYSIFSNAAIRGIEGYIKQITDFQECINSGLIKGKIIEFFDTNYNNSTQLYNYKIKDFLKPYFTKKQQDALEKVFTYYQKHRHEYVHVDNAVGSSKIIIDKEKCKEIINRVCNLIESTYSKEFDNEE